MFVAMLGILAGAGLVPHIVELAGGGRGGYRTMSLLIAGACLITMCAPLLMLAGRDPPAGVEPSQIDARGGTWVHLAHIIRHTRFLALSGAYILQLTAVGVLSASAPYLVTGSFGRGEGDVGTAMIGMLSATTLATPLWAWLGRRHGNARVLMLAVMSFALSTAALGGLAVSGGAWNLARLAFIVAGIPFAGMQVLPYTLVAHLIHATRESGESTLTGVWTACEKLGLAFGPALTALALAIGSQERLTSVAGLVIIAPAVLGLASLSLLKRAGQ
jgi:Na+/melibiose symporter-like transporter